MKIKIVKQKQIANYRKLLQIFVKPWLILANLCNSSLNHFNSSNTKKPKSLRFNKTKPNSKTSLTQNLPKLKSTFQFYQKLERWAEPDSDRRPLARKANVLTRLDDQPTRFSMLSKLKNNSLSFWSITMNP